ncbi:hypothetical protein LINGRAHAP2_LOCUS4815 [Linum grandiflorum]
MVGEGTNISTMLDAWVSTSPPSAPTPLPSTSPIPLTIFGLITSGRCDEALLRSLFVSSTVTRIISIPLPSIPIPDAWVWHYKNDGLYSVSSSYRLAQSIRPIPIPKSGPLLFDSLLWAQLWASPI